METSAGDKLARVDTLIKTLEGMAEKISRNREAGFAGAFVIAPPGASPLELLVLDSRASPAMFWSMLKTTVEMELSRLQDEEDASKTWGRR